MHFHSQKLIAVLAALAFTTSGNSAFAQDPAIPANVIFEKGIEYSNPDDQHLQVNIARPRTGDGTFPLVICIHGGGFRAGHRDGYNGLCLKLAEHGYVAVTVS